jgi:four helix bundle protein
MFKFERLEVWKLALAAYRRVTAATHQLRGRDHSFLVDQIKRAALSISSNIAEGTGRSHPGESKHFFNIAKGSTYEVVSIAYILQQEDLIRAADFSEIYQECDEVAKMLSGLIARQ